MHKTPKPIATRNDLPPESRAKSAELLQRQLSDAFDLRSQVKQAHWNVRGPHFYQLHLLFDQIAAALDEPIDDMAERITALGGTALGTVRAAAGQSRLPELPSGANDGMELVGLLADRMAAVGATTRAGIDDASNYDADTADLLTEVSRTLDKNLWFLEAHRNA